MEIYRLGNLIVGACRLENLNRDTKRESATLSRKSDLGVGLVNGDGLMASPTNINGPLPSSESAKHIDELIAKIKDGLHVRFYWSFRPCSYWKVKSQSLRLFYALYFKNVLFLLEESHFQVQDPKISELVQVFDGKIATLEVQNFNCFCQYAI